LHDIKVIDKKLLDFNEGLNLKISELSIKSSLENVKNENDMNEECFSSLIEKTEKDILEGIADDMNLNRGLEAILLLSKRLNSRNDYSLLDLIRIKAIFVKWINTMGLVYNQNDNETQNRNFKQTVSLNSFVKFRSHVREIALKSINTTKSNNLNDENLFNELKNTSEALLSLCDKLRKDLDGYGIKLKVSLF
jgi:cysteinyl-tRNA synthetase